MVQIFGPMSWRILLARLQNWLVSASHYPDLLGSIGFRCWNTLDKYTYQNVPKCISGLALSSWNYRTLELQLQMYVDYCRSVPGFQRLEPYLGQSQGSTHYDRTYLEHYQCQPNKRRLKNRVSSQELPTSINTTMTVGHRSPHRWWWLSRQSGGSCFANPLAKRASCRHLQAPSIETSMLQHVSTCPEKCQIE